MNKYIAEHNIWVHIGTIGFVCTIFGSTIYTLLSNKPVDAILLILVAIIFCVLLGVGLLNET